MPLGLFVSRLHIFAYFWSFFNARACISSEPYGFVFQLDLAPQTLEHLPFLVFVTMDEHILGVFADICLKRSFIKLDFFAKHAMREMAVPRDLAHDLFLHSNLVDIHSVNDR